jgi:hypothetical protein
MAKPPLGLLALILPIVFATTGYGAVLLTVFLWLWLDPHVPLILFRPPTPQEALHQNIFNIVVGTAGVAAGLLACWLVCRGLNRLGRRRPSYSL